MKVAKLKNIHLINGGFGLADDKYYYTDFRVKDSKIDF